MAAIARRDKSLDTPDERTQPVVDWLVLSDLRRRLGLLCIWTWSARELDHQLL
jgi:hypothetical protein